MPKVCVLIILACCLMLLTSCGGQATINEAEAIKAAKEATKMLPSPPSMYYVTSHPIGSDVDMRLWPDTAASNVGTYQACGAQSPCSYYVNNYTAVSSDFWGSGVHVTFGLEWKTGDGGIHQHKWKFFVSNNGDAKFEGEEGERLPDRGG